MRPAPLDRYLLLVTAAGGAVLLGGLLAFDPAAIGLAVVLLAVFAVLGELAPIRVPGREDEITTSTSFLFALLLTAGLPVALVVQSAASLMADLRARKRPLSALFNVGQYALSLGAAAGVLELLGGSAATPAARDLPAIAAAGATWFAVNNSLAGAAYALQQRLPVLPFLREDLAFQALVALVLVGFAPVAAVVGTTQPALLPLLLLPLLSVWHGGQASLRSEHQALHDALTGLPNRTLFVDRAEQALASARRSARSAAVLFLDLDRFKDVNDTLGHQHGDALLIEVGRRLQGALRASDTVARFGGDEFAVLLRDLERPEDAEAVAEKLLLVLREPIELQGVELDVHASVGIAGFPVHGRTTEELMRRADVAMYAAKEAHAGWAAYDREDDDFTLDRLAMAAELRQAFERDELVLHFQPQVDVASGALVGAEALVRWQHPVRGLLAPGVFLPVAEHTGLLRRLTDHVLARAVAQAAAWRKAGLPVRVAVNVSARDLADDVLPVQVPALLERHGLPAGALKLEVTEGELMVDPQRGAAVLARLAGLGVELAMDDFGTGHASLAYLKNLPLHELKVDRSFVKDMVTDADDATIVRSTLELARGLGLRTVAEGVEDDATLALLAELGCDAAQGFGISRPVPAGDFATWAAARATLPAAA